MDALENLEDYAYNLGVDVMKYPTLKTNVKGCCATLDGKVVFLNTACIRDSAEQRCVLAEELAHLETDTLLDITDYINPSFKKWLKMKNELKAKRRVVERLLPADRLRAALLLYPEVWQLAEFLTLPEDFVKMAIEIYKRKSKL